MWVRIIQATPDYAFGEIICTDYHTGKIMISNGIAIQCHEPVPSVPTFPHEQAILPPHEQR